MASYGAGLTEYDQVGKYDLNTGSTSTERSSGWTTYFKADLTHQLNKYNLIKPGFITQRVGYPEIGIILSVPKMTNGIR